VTVAVAWLVFASLLSPPLALIVLLAWLCGAHLLLLLPLAIYLLSTGWMAINAGLRHLRRRERFLDSLCMAPADILDQLARLLGWPRGELRVL
jgi:hypothetical protein